MIKHGSYNEYQRYLFNHCDRTFNDKTGTTFAHAKIGLNKLLFAFYSLLRFNTSIRQLDRVNFGVNCGRLRGLRAILQLS